MRCDLHPVTRRLGDLWSGSVALGAAVMLAIVAGCAANATQTIPAGALAPGSRVHIVALEGPPLMVPASGGGLFIIGAGQPALGIFNLLQLAAGMPDATRRSAEATKLLDSELRGASGWEPTRVLAEAVRDRLAASGVSATVDAALRPVPGLVKGEVHMLDNSWIRAVRAWHEDSTPVTDYAPLAAGGAETQVIEVAIRHYELAMGSLFLGIDARVVDARSGRVLGRVFQFNGNSMPSLEPVKETFADGGARYKAIFDAEARRLADLALAELRKAR